MSAGYVLGMIAASQPASRTEGSEIRKAATGFAEGKLSSADLHHIHHPLRPFRLDSAARTNQD